MFPLRLTFLDPRRIITASIVALALLVFALTFTLAWESYARYVALSQMVEVSKMADDLVAIAGTTAVERGVTMIALGENHAVSVESRDEIAQARQREERYSASAWARARELVRQLPDERDLGQAFDTVQRTHQVLRQVRARVDSCLKGEACDVDQKEWFAAATSFIAANADLRDIAFLPLQIPWDIAQLDFTVKRWLWTAAERMGRERAVLGYHLSARQPVPAELMQVLQVNRAIVEDKLAEIRAVRGRRNTDSRIAAAIDGMDTALGRFERARVLAYAGARSGDYALTGRQWFRDATGAIESILGVASAGTAITEGLIDKEVRAATARLLLHLAMLGVTVLLTAVSVTRVRQMANAIFAHAEEIEREVQRKTKDLRASEERTRMIIENAPDAVISMDAEGRITGWNPGCEKIFGWLREEVVGLDLADSIVPQRYRDAHREGFNRFLRDGSARILGQVVEVSALHRDGREFPVELAIGASALLKGGEYTFTAFLRDITKRKQAEEELSTLANYDTLTGLANRALFMDRLHQALCRHDRHGDYIFALLYLDLDGFKDINDTLGHAIGDKLLQLVASRITECLRKCDSAARLGGDEFTVILERVSHATDVGIVAQKIIDALAQPATIDGYDLFISTSIGITLCPADGVDAAELLRNADTAMYRAKEEGRGRYALFTKEMNERISRRVALEKSLRTALERNEFCLHYQPQVDLASGQIIGLEALIRWNHPERGSVSPLEFIPVAEDTGLIVPIGEWVLRSACAQTRKWAQAGFPPLRVAVNLSGRQFKQQGLANAVEAALRASGLDPAQLELEITETMAMEDADRSLATLSQLKAMGVTLALDDFGTGYSSLSYLKRFPIDTLKIDRSFVKDMTEDADDAAIARSIIAMAHSLKLKVVAEGVETPAQRALLQEFGCDEVQGYYFSKPLPATEISRILQRGIAVLPFLSEAPAG